MLGGLQMQEQDMGVAAMAGHDQMLEQYLPHQLQSEQYSRVYDPKSDVFYLVPNDALYTAGAPYQQQYQFVDGANYAVNFADNELMTYQAMMDQQQQQAMMIDEGAQGSGIAPHGPTNEDNQLNGNIA